MQASNAPTKSAVPFANSGTKNTIPVASQIGITPGLASFTDGFPPLTMTPLVAGGVPPYGADFNGILNFLSSGTRWSQAGGGYVYDAAFSTAIGGYPKGAMLVKADLTGYWLCTVDSNTTNPDSGGAGWQDALVGRLINVRVFSSPGASTYTPTSGTRSVEVEVVGGGGAGGSTQAALSSTVSTGSGGNAGGYARGRFTTGFSGVTVTIGAGGSPGAPGAVSGGAGGASSFGTLISATGGGGGAAGFTSAPPFVLPAASGFGVGANGYLNAMGGFGLPGFGQQLGNVISGYGGASAFGGGANAVGATSTGTASAGVNATSPGSGGSGAVAASSGAANSGGAGAAGMIIVREYA